MNDAQRLWWEQAKSDHALFVLLRREGCDECHLLHYLQMSTEKLAKAYLWRSGSAPPPRHIGFAPLMKALVSRGDLPRIAGLFGFDRPKDMKAWVTQASPLAHELHKLAPAAANDGPNLEYPWPHEKPAHCPATHRFPLWAGFRDRARGRRPMIFIERAVERFGQYA